MQVYPLGREKDGVEATVRFEVSGRYRRATWGPWGGSPEEFPETRVHTATFEDPETDEEVTLDQSQFSAKEWKRIEQEVADDIGARSSR